MARIALNFKKKELDQYVERIKADREAKQKTRNFSANLRREFKKKYGV